MTADLEPPTEVETPIPTVPFTSRRARVRAVLVWGAALLVWSTLIGVPNDPLGVFVWIWLAMVAWHAQAPREFHLRFPRDWWPVLLGLVLYWLTRGLTDEVGLPVHVSMPIRFDRWLDSFFGGDGSTPTEALQHAWCGDPCLRSTEPRWWDLFFSTVYATHFATGLTLAAVLWTRNRAEWVIWMRRYLSLNFAALVIYMLYPMAPPWMASRDGYLGEVHRITSRGWGDIGLSRANMVLQGMGNQTAAMPSLHAGVTFLVAFYAIWRLRSPLRWLLLLYPVAMSTALVYFAEHYVVDVLAGGLLAALVMAGCWWWEWLRAPTAGAQPPGTARTIRSASTT